MKALVDPWAGPVRKGASAVALVVALCFLLSGCSASATEGDSAPQTVTTVPEALSVAQQRGLDWEAGVLEDGVISAGEYEQTYDRYMRCQEDLDYVFTKPKVLDPVSGLQWQAIAEWQGTGEPGLLDPNNPCDSRFYLIETPYLASTPHRMDPVLREGFVVCLDENNLPYRGDEVSFEEFTASLSDAELVDGESTGTYVSCLLDTVKQLFPEVLWVSYGR